MYPPGRMIYLRRMKYKEADRSYFDAVYIEPWEIIDEGILISKHMYDSSFFPGLNVALLMAVLA